MDISTFPKDLRPIVEFVPNYVDNTPASPLWEARVSNALVLFCGLNLTGNAAEVEAMRNAIMEYMRSDAFCPAAALPEDIPSSSFYQS